MPRPLERFYFDFETESIEDGQRVPEPVLLAYAVGRRRAQCTRSRAEMQRVLQENWHRPIVAHNAVFDVGIAMFRLGLPAPSDVHDTQVQAFLLDPFSVNLGLKERVRLLLGREPVEEKALTDWVIANVGCTAKQAGRYYALAPDDLLAPYARADVEMMRALDRAQTASLRSEKLLEAYNRERAMIVVAAELQELGLRIDRPRLEAMVRQWLDERARLREWIRNDLQVSELNFQSAAQVNAALLRREYLHAPMLGPKGGPSYRWSQLRRQPGIPRALKAAWRAQAKRTKLIEVGQKWLSIADGEDRIHCAWRLTAGHAEGRGKVGARTGRLSSSPNLQNIPKRVETEAGLPIVLGPAPVIREVIVPAPGSVLLRADYAQQEVRIFSHLAEERGMPRLAEIYRRDPDHDFFDVLVRDIEPVLGRGLPRTQLKITTYSLFYGSGVPGLSSALECTEMEALDIRTALYKLVPELPRMQQTFRALVNGRTPQGSQPFWTWGGRRYYVEREVLPETQIAAARFGREFSYRSLNYAIQGSAADCLKQAMLAYHHDPRRRGRLVCSIHDELWVEVAEEQAEAELALLVGATESVQFRVPMRAKGQICRHHVAEEDAT